MSSSSSPARSNSRDRQRTRWAGARPRCCQGRTIAQRMPTVWSHPASVAKATLSVPCCPTMRAQLAVQRRTLVEHHRRTLAQRRQLERLVGERRGHGRAHPLDHRRRPSCRAGAGCPTCTVQRSGITFTALPPLHHADVERGVGHLGKVLAVRRPLALHPTPQLGQRVDRPRGRLDGVPAEVRIAAVRGAPGESRAAGAIIPLCRRTTRSDVGSPMITSRGSRRASAGSRRNAARRGCRPPRRT